MKEEKTDRRVKYTIMVIKESFIRLLKEKSISKISIKEICEGADVNRATFYAHYSDQYDLLHQIENDLIDDVNAYLSSYNLGGGADMQFEMLVKILEYIKENSDLCDMLLNSNGDIEFQQEIIHVFGQQQLLPTAVSESLNTEDAQYVFLFFANGFIGMIKQWLKDGMEKSAEELAKLMLRVLLNGKSSFENGFCE